jgi:PAS domain S-box-containing protein
MDATGSAVREIDQPHRATRRARLEDRSFERLVQSVLDYAIYMLDLTGHVSSWNRGAERIKGYSADEIIGQHFSRFYTAEDLAAGVPALALNTARREGRYVAEGWRQRKDGTRFWASVVIDAIHDDDGALIGFAKVTRDLTERRDAQLELERSRELLFQAQKMEAVGQLTGGLAHDFNNLLTGIAGNLELLSMRIAQGRLGELERYIAAAQGAANRAAAVTHRLLAFSRQQPLDTKAIDANKLISGMEELVRRTVGPAIQVETGRAAGLWPIFCDPHQLENALLNLCINSRDAMPEGGRLNIEAANSWLDDNDAREGEVSPGEYVAISVSDSGEGMAPDITARAFDPFFTTKPIGKGTGLGLSMVYGFAKQSGGFARIDSEVGQGTTVRIYLPRHLGEAMEEPAPARLSPIPRAKAGGTVLVVDDEASIRMLIVETLAELGYGSIEAADAQSGLEALESNDRIDLLITDVGLPGGVNGRQMADTARRCRPALKVLFITGYAENAATGKKYLEPGMHLLVKPFAMEMLATRIKSILAV